MNDQKETQTLVKKIMTRWNWATGNRKKPFTDEEAAQIALDAIREYERERAEKIIGHYISTCQFIKEENLIVRKAMWQAQRIASDETP